MRGRGSQAETSLGLRFGRGCVTALMLSLPFMQEGATRGDPVRVSLTPFVGRD